MRRIDIIILVGVCWFGVAHAQDNLVRPPDTLVLSDFVLGKSLKTETADFRAVVTQTFPDNKDSVIVAMRAPGAAYRVGTLLTLRGVGSFVLFFPETMSIHPNDLKEVKEEEHDGQGKVSGLEWSNGAEHQYAGRVQTGGYVFESDPNYPLTFKIVKGKGYVYLCGRGVVIAKNGRNWILGSKHKISDWLPLLVQGD
jgi:hypothetical protein